MGFKVKIQEVVRAKSKSYYINFPVAFAEAIEIEKTGLKVLLSKSTDLTLPDELLAKFEKNNAFKQAFFALTPGRQRGYNLFFSGSKQSNTRVARIEKYQGRILKGIGINDCTCGLSKRMPRCDGSHKQEKKSF